MTEAKVIYTDNVSELSATRRLVLAENPSQPTIVPLKNPQDVVWEPSLDVRRVSETTFGQTEFSMKATGFIYTDHSMFNHGELSFAGEADVDSGYVVAPAVPVYSQFLSRAEC